MRTHAPSWLLLTVIALRGRYREGTGLDGLSQGQALLGDLDEYGISEQEYRTAKEKLSAWGLASFKGTNKGTIATLLSRDIYSIFGNPCNEQSTADPQPSNDQETGDERPGNGSETTNKTERKDDMKEGRRSPAPIAYKNGKVDETDFRLDGGDTKAPRKSGKQGCSRRVTPSLDEWLAHAREIGWTDQVDAERSWNYYEANGWRQKGGNLIHDWWAAARTCKKRNLLGGLPSHANGTRGGGSLEQIDYAAAKHRGKL